MLSSEAMDLLKSDQSLSFVQPSLLNSHSLHQPAGKISVSPKRRSRDFTPTTITMQESRRHYRNDRGGDAPRHDRNESRPPRPIPTSVPKVGDEVEGVVTRIAEYGAFMELPGGSSGLLHISEIAHSFIKDVSEHASIGQKLKVRVISVENSGRKISLSLRQAISSRATGYDRVLELGGDWGHPWNDDGKTTYLKFPSDPQISRPHHWEPDLTIFKRFDKNEDKNNQQENVTENMNKLGLNEGTHENNLEDTI